MEELITAITIFVLATFIGYFVITKIPPTLHTPLMSGTNAISGIVLVGAIIVTGLADNGVVLGMAVAAIVLAAINVFGGFLVTDRMLKMFRREEPPA